MSSIMGSRGWKRTGAFDLEHGGWQGEEFAIDPSMVEAATTFIAMNDVPGVIIREVHETSGDARLIILVSEPVKD